MLAQVPGILLAWSSAAPNGTCQGSGYTNQFSTQPTLVHLVPNVRTSPLPQMLGWALACDKKHEDIITVYRARSHWQGHMLTNPDFQARPHGSEYPTLCQLVTIRTVLPWKFFQGCFNM